MSQIHKSAKIIFYTEIAEYLPPEVINNLYIKYLKLSNSAETQGERDVAKIVTKRYNDFLLIIGR